MSRRILELTSEEVLEHFSKSEQYHNYELPEYFNFYKVLAFVRERISVKSLVECMA